jgi:iron complex transport system permease protein
VNAAHRQRQRSAALLALLTLLALGLSVMTGADGFGIGSALDPATREVILIDIRLPRTLGALLIGALLGLAGAIAQGLFRNPLADPYLLGSAAGAGLAVVAMLAFGAALLNPWFAPIGMVGAAFIGALSGMLLALSLAGGANQPLKLLLAGVVVGILLGAASELITTLKPEALRGRQAFLLGSCAWLGWRAVVALTIGAGLLIPLVIRLSRALDALTLGEDSALSLGVDLPRVRLLLIGALALATALAVAHAGLVAFVGLIAPHLVRRFAPGRHAWLLGASAASGALLLLLADILARALLPPNDLPVGILTALLGGALLLGLLRRQVSL